MYGCTDLSPELAREATREVVSGAIAFAAHTEWSRAEIARTCQTISYCGLRLSKGYHVRRSTADRLTKGLRAIVAGHKLCEYYKGCHVFDLSVIFKGGAGYCPWFCIAIKADPRLQARALTERKAIDIPREMVNVDKLFVPVKSLGRRP